MENKFLGRGWSFPPEFYAHGAAVEMKEGTDDIKQSLQILLSTALQERIMQSGFGCDLNRFLFEEISQGVVNDIRNTVSDAILNHESRILVDDIQVGTSDSDHGLLTISIAYTIQMTNTRSNLVYPFYINEASI